MDLSGQFQLNFCPQMAKSFPDQMSKKNHICQWISFILTFDMIEEMASAPQTAHS